MITVHNLQKTYERKTSVRGTFFSRYQRRSITALSDISFSIPPGQAVAYLGRNGAGKSTTIKCLSGILTPTAGNVTVDGLVPWERRPEFFSKIGVVFGQRSQLIWDLPTRDSFELLSAQYGIPRARVKERIAYLDRLFGLQEILDSPVRSLSLGQRVLADVAAVLLHEPKVLFLDEPTIGLDVVNKCRLREIIGELKRGGTTILLTTHDLTDMEKVADRVILIDGGAVSFDGTVGDFRSNFSSGVTVEVTFGEPIEDIPSSLNGGSLSESGLRYSISVASTKELPRVINSMTAAGLEISEVSVNTESIEDIVRHILDRDGARS